MGWKPDNYCQTLFCQAKALQSFPVLQMLSRSSRRIHSTPPPVSVRPSSSSNTAPPRSPASPPHRSSPFRFTGQAQARFSPSMLSPSPPPSVSPSPHRAESPQRSLSSMSGHEEVLSLEELFPVGPGSEDPHSEMSLASSEGARSPSGQTAVTVVINYVWEYQ